mgnify:CR=1 FL=1
MKKLGLVIVLLCLSMAVSAGGFMFKHLEVKDGLSSNRVNDIFKRFRRLYVVCYGFGAESL